MAPILPYNMEQYINLLQRLIATPSFSKEEDATAQLMAEFLEGHGCTVHRQGNNVWAFNKHFDPQKPNLLLNSHHDTVKPNSGYTCDPFEPTIEDGKLYGLGSNDAGGPLVSLLAAFIHFYDQAELPFNMVFAATAEEEISGKGGVESIIPELGNVILALVGEPTLMQMAVAERGLLVLDGVVHGKAGHAARNEGINAIYEAMHDVEWFNNYEFERSSRWLGPVSMNLTQINAGTAHNQVPGTCHYVVDIRLNEHYSHQDVLDIVRLHIKGEVKERSTRIKPSFIATNHPMVEAGEELGLSMYGSPTTSDMALMDWPTLKIGPGDSARSHSADEFIYIHEIEQGIQTYIKLIESYSQKVKAQ